MARRYPEQERTPEFSGLSHVRRREAVERERRVDLGKAALRGQKAVIQLAKNNQKTAAYTNPNRPTLPNSPVRSLLLSPMPSSRRNDPCPCGSGLAFKRCHGRLTVQQGGLADSGDTGAPPGVHEFPTPRAGVRWEVDLLPLPIALEDNPDARPVILLVLGDGQILEQEMLNPPPSDTPGIAAVILQHLRVGVDRAGFWPPVVALRTPELCRAVRAIAGAVPCRFEAGPLPQFEDASRGLLAFLSPGLEDRPLGLSFPETWKGWGLPAGQIAALFDAAAAYARALPWERITYEDLLEADCPTGNQWTVCVMGNGGVEAGLALYGDPEDIERQFLTNDPWGAVAELRGPVLSLLFNRWDELPPVMRKEILAAGWTVAGPEFYPALMALNTPGGGVTATQLADLRDILRALVSFARKFGAELDARADDWLRWTDPKSGVTLTLTRESPLSFGLWEPPAVLSSALPAGARANPAAALARHDPEALREEWQRHLIRFTHHLHHDLARPTVLKHAANAILFLSFLAETEGIPVEAMTEFDLRAFLYDWAPRARPGPKADIRALPGSLKRLFRFLATDAGLEFPWAWEILADREAFTDRYESAAFAQDDELRFEAWTAELSLDLEARGFLPEPAMANGTKWGEMQGTDEQALYRELRRRWLLWRDEAIAAGLTEPAAVSKELGRRQRAWELAPHDAFHGRSPVEVIQRERKTARRGRR
jgi:hypothetical protein